jgi:hypothetical protein
MFGTNACGALRVVGANSFGEGCARAGKPGVRARGRHNPARVDPLPRPRGRGLAVVPSHLRQPCTGRLFREAAVWSGEVVVVEPAGQRRGALGR